MRVRLTRIEGLDLNLFEFDLDLTLAMFFLNADQKVYARYCGRDARDADNRQSLAGLRYTMKSVLEMHAQEKKTFAPRSSPQPKYASRFSGFGGKGGGCIHCHQAKEREYAGLQRQGEWDRTLVWRYPLPDNLGLVLEVDRGNIVRKITPGSPAATAGLQPGDRVRELADVPIHSFADAQFSLDRVRKQTEIVVSWERNGQPATANLMLKPDWYKTDLSWRRSIHRFVPSLRLFGKDLTAEEKKQQGLAADQLAFRPRAPLNSHVRAAGIAEGDIILGLDGVSLKTDVSGFYDYVAQHYLAGERVVFAVLRNGKRLTIPMTLVN